MTHPYTRLFVLPAPPDADNDETEGYELGDTVHVEGGSIYECRDPSTGAAVWEEQAAGGAVDLASVGAALNTAAADTPLDADTIHFWDAVDAILKKITWANIKATLKTYFDTLYANVVHSHGTILTAENVYDIMWDSMSHGVHSGVDITFDDGGDDLFFALNIPYVQNIIENYTAAAGGWIPDSDTWTRTGNHSYTKSGDHTTTHRKSAKIRYKDGGAYEFGVIGSSSYVGGGTNLTTINLIPNTDFAMAAATITDTYISYIENPEGFPHWFNFDANPQGFSAVPSSPVYRWQAVGRNIHIAYVESNNGTSNATTFTASAPIAPVQNVTGVAGTLVNNGALLTVAGRLTMTAGNATITFRTDMATGAWAGGGTGKRAVAYWWYEY